MNKNKYLWIIKAKLCFTNDKWMPVINFPNVSSIHNNKDKAIQAAITMTNHNINNKDQLTVNYKPFKYREED